MKYEKKAARPEELGKWLDLINSVPFKGSDIYHSWQTLWSIAYLN
jgi:hypothetical protein